MRRSGGEGVRLGCIWLAGGGLVGTAILGLLVFGLTVLHLLVLPSGIKTYFYRYRTPEGGPHKGL